MPELASHIASVPPSGIRRLFEVALTMTDVNVLAVGEPDMAVAPHIVEAAREAWANDETDYTPNGGIAPLRTAIVGKLERDNGIQVDTDQVWVTIGATQALYQAMGLVLDAGDEILIPDPGYTTFTMNARMLEARPVAYSLLPEHGFMPDFGEWEALVTPRTRAILVNTPSNPLGHVFPEDILRKILDFARAHDLWIISDEVYEYFTYGKKHVSIASLDHEDRVLSIFSLSKTYAMTGVRVGYLVVPRAVVPKMSTVQEAMVSCVSTPGQHAALAALTGPQDAVVAAKAHYRENGLAAAALLTERGIRYLMPDGAFYLWIDLSHATGGDVARWAEEFLMDQRVAVAPGSAFGASGEGWIRVCLAVDSHRLDEGLSRLPSP